MKASILMIFFSVCASVACNSNSNHIRQNGNNGDSDEKLEVQKISLPDGFKIQVYAEIENARSMTLSPSGTVYVGNRGGDKVYAVQDLDGDGKAENTFVIASGLKSPNGVAFRNGDLYVAEISRILKFPDVERDLSNPPDYEVVTADYPTEGQHGWKYIAFGPDGKLYVPVGAPCNICESEDEIFASITRINPDGSGREIVAEGVRNTVGFDWHPETNELWFTDNGRDMMGDNVPPCELNRLSTPGQHFGYPYCHGNDIGDPEFGHKRHCNEFSKPAWNFEAHTAPLGMTFYTGDMFPDDYKGDILVAQHGSWNRSKKIGYRVMRVHIEGNRATAADIFAAGWLDEASQESWGRPVDVLQMPDGAILISDDQGGRIYRISYDKKS